MIREAVLPDEVDEISAIWLAANEDAHAFAPDGFWRKSLPEVKRSLPGAELLVFVGDNRAIVGFVGLTGSYVAGLFVRRESRSWTSSRGTRGRSVFI